MILAHHEDNDGWYGTTKVQCHSCAARERATKGTSKEPYEPAPGERIATSYTRPATKPLAL
jgi:hypothetical protein